MTYIPLVVSVYKYPVHSVEYTMSDSSEHSEFLKIPRPKKQMVIKYMEQTMSKADNYSNCLQNPNAKQRREFNCAEHTMTNPAEHSNCLQYPNLKQPQIFKHMEHTMPEFDGGSDLIHIPSPLQLQNGLKSTDYAMLNYDEPSNVFQIPRPRQQTLEYREQTESNVDLQSNFLQPPRSMQRSEFEHREHAMSTGDLVQTLIPEHEAMFNYPTHAHSSSDECSAYLQTASPKQQMIYKCGICFEMFVDVQRLMEHVAMHIGDRPNQRNGKLNKCPECYMSFTYKQSMKRHMKSVHTPFRNYTCIVCSETFLVSDLLQSHMLSHMKPSTSSAFQCLGVNQHCLTKKHKCPICTQSFNNRSNLAKHMVVHTGERSFKCDICHSTFTQKSNLKKHMMVHSGERPFKCTQCSSTFNQKSHLQRHMVVHTLDRPFKCLHCSCSYTVNASLIKHSTVHIQ